MTEPLDKFGEFFVRNLRDKALGDLEMLLRGVWKSPSTQHLQERLGTLNDEQKALVREVAERIVTTGMHDFLFALQCAHDEKKGIEAVVDGTSIASLSDGLHGEIFSEDGWIAHHSEFPHRTNG